MIDERALEAALAYVAKSQQLWADPEATRKLIEAYEAALWRPIEEAPRDGSEIWMYNGRMSGVGYFERYGAHPGWRWLEGAKFLAKPPTVFRTINPPPQKEQSK